MRLHVSSPPVTETIPGTRPGRWSSEIRFGDLPAEGVDITLTLRHRGPLRISGYDRTHGLAAVPGFVPRPAGLEPPPGDDSDTVLVRRSYTF